MMINFRIRTKFILLGFLGTFALISIVLLALHVSRLGLENIEKVFQDSKQVQHIQQDLIVPVFNLRELSLSSVVAPNEDFRKKIKEDIFMLVSELDEKFDTASSAVREDWSSYRTSLYTTIGYLDASFEEGAFINANKDEREEFYALMQSLQNLQKKELQKSSSTYNNARHDIDRTRIFIFIVSATLGLFSLIVGWFIINKITNAIELVRDGHKQFFKFLRNKDNQVSVGISLDSQDELGQMAQEINTQMTDAQKALTQDLKFIEAATQMVAYIKEGNLQKRLEVEAKSKELNTLRDVINNMADDLELKIQEEINRRTDQEKLLIQQSKLAAMGNMIGNIAHQWRQPLSELNAILMNIETRYKFGDFDETYIERKVQECNKITSYMSTTITDFQNFFKPSKKKEEFNVVEACKKASSILSSSLKYHAIDFECSCDVEQKVIGYPNEFSQAFLNILSNAKDVLIQRKVASPFIRVSIKTGKQYVLIKVEDNGGGIDSKYIDRIYEPYFTTKHAKQGTGIGLYMSKTIIENNMDGILSVHNTDVGACFIIKLHSLFFDDVILNNPGSKRD
jgi:signal transduction histidine kinase